jgi:perosamine synthetase
VPLARPNLGTEELRLVAEVLESGALALGRFATEFENAIARMADRRYGVACSSGTAGLHLAVRALGIGPGDEMITTPFSFVASANCLLYEGAIPRFVDIEEETLGLNPELIADAATERTKGILAVDVFGQPCQIAALEAMAVESGWVLLEDSCEALGSSLNGRPLGSFGSISVFAFYPNKQITTGEGGAVVTDDAAMASRMRRMANQGRDDEGTWLRHVELGFNYRMDELSAAVGVAQLRRFEELRAGRRHAADAYEVALADIDRVTVPRSAAGAEVDWFVYVVRLDPSVDRDRLIDKLAEEGVPSRPYFTPLHLQPFYRERFGFQPGDFPVTERIADSTLALPFSSLMSDDEVAVVADALKASLDTQHRG